MSLHTLPELEYDYDDLEPYIDAWTMELHHLKHHQAYVDQLNLALARHPELQSRSLVDLVSSLETVPEDIRTVVRNNGGGVINHSLYFSMMGPTQGGEPAGRLAEGIHTSFGSFETFRQKFNAAALASFGSGWTWLTLDPTGRLAVESTPNQDNPLMTGRAPLLGIDLWEHAYYLQYQNRRADYLHAWWQVVNWNHVANIYTSWTGALEAAS